MSIRKRLARTVLSGIFVGQQYGFNTLCSNLAAVHHQVGVGITETFLGDNHCIEPELFRKPCSQRGRTLFIGKRYVLVGYNDTDKVVILSVPLIQFVDNGAVLVHIRRVFIAGGNTVAAYDCAVHRFRRIHNGRNNLLNVDTVVVGVMQQSLTLERIYIADFRKIGVLFGLFNRVQGFVDFGFCRSNGFCGVTQIAGSF